ncbi:pyridoxine 5'-phosphate synthase [Tundrisphaera lichenicola]|uniref:pyridoxine 5'-phosphate synthase n=1 Tax=Tundrisphaera lichenicola TaxID=2029860 RepID=UPI003EB95348
MPRLGVNIDHVATLRQARGGREPDPVWAAVEAELAGADGITVHLREDRRHIQDRDLRILRETVRTRLNLELAIEPSIVAIALEVRPDQVTFVPERRAELTTEGGLDVVGQRSRVAEAVARCRDAGLEVSLFIDPSLDQVAASAEVGAQAVELHTGQYAEAHRPAEIRREWEALVAAGKATVEAGMILHAGHGLDYWNVGTVARIPGMTELNIGHSIIARSIFSGLRTAVADMKRAMESPGEFPRG